MAKTAGFVPRGYFSISSNARRLGDAETLCDGTANRLLPTSEICLAFVIRGRLVDAQGEASKLQGPGYYTPSYLPNKNLRVTYSLALMI